MNSKKTWRIFPYKTAEHISLVKYTKSACGVDFLLNTAESSEKRGWFDLNERYRTDFFEFYFFRKASGYLLLDGQRIELHDNSVLIVAPYKQQEWHIRIDSLDYTFLVFQEEFVQNFSSDKHFMYRLLYCYQNDYPSYFDMNEQQMIPFLEILRKMKTELLAPVADSYHMIVAYLYEFLLLLNRFYADFFGLSLRLPLNNYAFRYKELLEKNIRRKNRVNDYAEMMGISRVALNKAVENEFGVTAAHLLKQRLLQEVKSDLLFSGMTVKEVAYKLRFSAPNHLMRFFKQQTGKTIGAFMAEIDRDGLS
ncbi:MAG: AraC family transcriptional regulator [Alistipes senegalensis]|nr:AraC family transcriptional regulator [Bacteroides cellulosilyticus]MCM1352887.1 AraC family transcriptional regulator [Alistipes senegalensis]